MVSALCALGALLLPSSASALPQRPLIHAVTFTGQAGDYTVVLKGHGFGPPPVALPFSGDTSSFRIGDNAELSSGEWGYRGDTHTLDYRVWTGTEIEIGGLGAGPGDALVIALWNAHTGLGATWGGDVPPVATGTPTITSVGFSSLGTLPDLRIAVHGRGFGPAPKKLPYVGDLDSFYFWDGRANCRGFSAGGSYFGALPPDAVTFRYESWSDTKIVITGFRGAYGTLCDEVRTGDPVVVSVWNSAATSDTGPQAAKRGSILVPGGG
jgi:hypothetical protein